MTTTPVLELTKHEVRNRICARCPWRPLEAAQDDAGFPRHACEETCTLFAHLDGVLRRAQLVDPLVGHRRKAVKIHLDQLVEAEGTKGPAAPLAHFRRKLVDIVDRTADGLRV